MRPHPRDPSPRVAIAIGVIALAAAIASVMPQLHANTWIFRDGRFYVNVATTIVEDLTIEQHAFASSWYSGTLGWNANLEAGWSNVALGARGEHWPKHPWIHPLIASPVVFAFGLPGTLGWNLLMFALIASGLYRFARAYAEPAYAAMGVAIFVMGTVLLESAYDFSVDVLMLALFAQGLAAVLSGRGVIAGICIALCVVIKPTALMLMPALVFTIAERRDRTTLGRSLGAGTLVLVVYAAINTWMYGRPWLSGYNRTLVTVRGEPTVADHLDAFGTPFAEGFARMWGGYYGLASTFTAMVLAGPGLIALARRRPLHALGATLGVVASLVVFAKYEHEGHRFHWPALALLVPSLATTLELVGRALRALRTRLKRRSDAPRAAGRAASIAVLATCAVTLLSGPSMEQRVIASGDWGIAALDFARSLELPGHAANLLVIAFHLAVAGLLASRVARLLERVVPVPVAAFVVAACALVPAVRDACVSGGPVLVGMAALALGVERARERSWIVAALASCVAVAMWLVGESAAEASLVPLLARSLDVPSSVRMLVPWLVLSLPGLCIAARRDPRTALALGVLSLATLVPGVGVRGSAWMAITAIPLAAPAAITAEAFASAMVRAARDVDVRRVALVIGAALALLLSIGGVRRVLASREPFRIATYEGARHALVFHDRVPCDFLAWEHLSWECSHFDAGLYGMVGLAVSDPIRVGGEPREMMIVPTGRSGQERRVVWPAARGGRRLTVRWAVPDGMRGDGVLVVRVDDRELASIEIPARGDDAIHEVVIDTADAEGRDARLELSMRPSEGRHHQAVVALDAIWD